jgi:hypothetical protein
MPDPGLNGAANGGDAIAETGIRKPSTPVQQHSVIALFRHPRRF